MTPPAHHREIAKFLSAQFNGNAKVTLYRDNNDANPIPIGEFGYNKKLLYSTIGAFDMHFDIPEGNFEFASCGNNKWLPNVLASSIYWLDKRNFSEWPLVCEDVVKHNAKSTYRHMAYVPSTFSLKVSTGKNIQWLLGVPVSDKEIGLSHIDVLTKAQEIYPDWLFNE